MEGVDHIDFEGKEKLFELETLLEDDLARKPKHQKPKLQSQWREEIALINSKLNL